MAESVQPSPPHATRLWSQCEQYLCLRCGYNTFSLLAMDQHHVVCQDPHTETPVPPAPPSAAPGLAPTDTGRGKKGRG